jgi:hypothetical protein
MVAIPFAQPALLAVAMKFTGLVVCELLAGLVIVTTGVVASAVALKTQADITKLSTCGANLAFMLQSLASLSGRAFQRSFPAGLDETAAIRLSI